MQNTGNGLAFLLANKIASGLSIIGNTTVNNVSSGLQLRSTGTGVSGPVPVQQPNKPAAWTARRP